MTIYNTKLIYFKLSAKFPLCSLPLTSGGNLFETPIVINKSCFIFFHSFEIQVLNKELDMVPAPRVFSPQWQTNFLSIPLSIIPHTW